LSERLPLDEAHSGKLLRIFLGEGDRHGNEPLYTALIDAFRAASFTGATVLKGIEGFGTHKAVHAARSFDFSTNLPIVIEVVEEERKILDFLPTLQSMMHEGLITLENVTLVRLSRKEGAP